MSRPSIKEGGVLPFFDWCGMFIVDIFFLSRRKKQLRAGGVVFLNFPQILGLSFGGFIPFQGTSCSFSGGGGKNGG